MIFDASASDGLFSSGVRASVAQSGSRCAQNASHSPSLYQPYSWQMSSPESVLPLPSR
jgi:hypothetical protein